MSASDASADTLPAALGAAEGRPVLGQRYELLGLLGAGGMGNVYRARDADLDELVAIKVLRPELLGSPGAHERFRREVKLARRVTHPNVARVFDLGEHDGDRILTMELVDGESLARLLERDGALPVPRALEVAAAVCAGVGAAHAAGVVHRDLKPDNVLVARDGRVVVTDFGIARALEAAHGARTNGIVGTPAYMAPEQVDEQAPIDGRADVYAFGAMLYEMLVGTPPWTGETVIAVAAARLLRPPPDPRAARPDLDSALAQVVLRCMARRPADRFATFADVAAALAALAPVSTTRPPSPVPARPRSAGLTPAATDKRVAVLPFRNLGAPELEWLADGLTEDLIDLLSVAQGLRVCSRGVVMPLKGAARDPRELGRELDVQVVVEGSIRRADGRCRIQARLVSVLDGFQLWAHRFEGPDSDMLMLNDQVASAVADALTIDLAPAGRAPADVEAVDLYLRARTAYHSLMGSPTDSVALFAEALRRSPSDPRVIAGWVMSRTRALSSTGAELHELRRDAERALALAPSLPEAHVALGMVCIDAHDEAGAVVALRRALRLTSNSAEAHDALGRLLSEADRDEGRRHLEAAVALDPNADFARSALARHLEFAGDPAAADAVLDTYLRGRATPVEARFCLWRHDVARAEELLAMLTGPHPPHQIGRALLEATLKWPSTSRATLELPQITKPRARIFVAQIRVEVACAWGALAAALEALAEADGGGLIDVAWMDRCPALAPLRGDATFATTRERVAERASRVVAAYLAAGD